MLNDVFRGVPQGFQFAKNHFLIFDESLEIFGQFSRVGVLFQEERFSALGNLVGIAEAARINQIQDFIAANCIAYVNHI